MGMGKNLLDFPEARKVFDSAKDISKLCLEGPEEELRRTQNAQPAIFLVGMASYEVFRVLKLDVRFAAGHSVGEYGALAAAGVLAFPDALSLVKKRGDLMFQAGLKRPGTMAAILGLSVEAVESICRETSDQKMVEIANLNSPNQVVISGDSDAVKAAGELARARGAKKVVPLSVSGAFHSALMEEAARELAGELDQVSFQEGKFSVVSNITARPVVNGSEARELLKRQIRGRVLWEETVKYLLNQGVTMFVEMEPGNVLTGLVRSIDRRVKTVQLEHVLGLTPSR